MSQESVKIKYERASGCLFMIQQIKVTGKYYLLGSSIDGFLFLYRIQGKMVDNRPASQFETQVYPVSVATYSDQSNTLNCGCVNGSIYIFKDFSQNLFGRPAHYRFKENQDTINFSLCTFSQDYQFFSINYPSSIFKFGLSDDPNKLLTQWKQFDRKISQAIYFEPEAAAGPHIAINFLDERPPILLNQIQDYFNREELVLEDEEEQSHSTCMIYCKKTHQIVVGCYNGDINVYGIVMKKDGVFCQKKVAFSYSSQNLILQLSCWQDQLVILTLKSMKKISLKTYNSSKAKNQAEGVKNLKGLLTVLDNKIIVLGSKNLNMLKEPYIYKECTFKLLGKQF